MAEELVEDTQSPLLNLPTEIRINIYQKLFDSAWLSIDVSNHQDHPQHCGYTICSCEFAWEILRTCRQLRAEALPYLLAATTLQVGSSMDKAYLLPATYLANIPRAVVLNVESFSKRPWELDRLHALQTLELRNITVWCKYLDAPYLDSRDGEEVMYDLAMFNLNRISSQLTMLCNERKKGFKILLCCQYVVSSSSHETIHAVIDVDSKKVLHKSKGPAIRDRNAWAGFY